MKMRRKITSTYVVTRTLVVLFPPVVTISQEVEFPVGGTQDFEDGDRCIDNGEKRPLPRRRSRALAK